TQSSTHSSTHSSTQSPERTARALPGRWASAASVEKGILDFATGRYVTLRELAQALERSEKTPLQNYISRLVREGKLTPLHPDKPTSPHQSYTRARGAKP
ncbi:MAG: hypothetical protein WCJ30_26635, partial [Deltaproteobacteria bacterium]